MGLGLGLNLGLSNADESGAGGAAPAEPLTPPEGMTGWLKLDDAEVGAFPSTANAGSISANWLRAGSAITIEADGPNGMKYAEQPSAASDYLQLGAGATIGDFFDNNAGMYSAIVRTGLTDSTGAQWEEPGIIEDTGDYMGIGQRSSGAAKLVPWGWDDAESKIELAYTANAWAVVTVRWNGTNIFAKINAGAWQSPSSGNLDNLGATTGVLRLIGNGAKIPGMAEMLMYSTVNSEANGDAAHAYLRERSGI